MRNEGYEPNPPHNIDEIGHDASEYLAEEDERLIGTFNSAIPKGDVEQLSRLQERLASRIRIIDDYASGKTPSYGSYANIIDSLLTATEGMEDPDLDAKRSLAEGRMQELRLAVRRYVERVTKYQHVRMKMLREDEEMYRDDLFKIDIDRRKAHDALIETLQTTGKVIAQLREAVRENDGTDAKVQAYPSGRGDATGDLIFDGEFLADREKVRDWAIAAWTVEQVRKAKEKAAA